MWRIQTAVRNKARSLAALAAIMGVLAILPGVLAGCKDRGPTETADNAGEQTGQADVPDGAAQQQAEQDKLAAIEAIKRVAAGLPVFESPLFIYHGRIDPRRYAFVAPEDAMSDIDRYMAALLSIEVSVDTLVDLLAHDDPKVRTLAIALLVDKEDPSVLPRIAALLDDDAVGFPVPEGFGETEFQLSFQAQWSEQTVGEVAWHALWAYGQGVFGGHFRGSDRIAWFDAYWAARKDREYCAGWFALKLARASRGVYPTRVEYIADIQSVRTQIDAVGGDDRAWTLLWLYGERGSDVLGSEAELVEMCQQLGPDKLLAMLRNEIPTDDPDLQPHARNSWPHARMGIFVLQHAEQLLRPSDAPTLIAYQRLHRSKASEFSLPRIQTPWWGIAAARLAPANAADHLRPSFEYYYSVWDRAKLAVAMWQFGGASELAFLTDWLYNQKPEASTKGAGARYIELITEEDTPLARRTVAMIIRDERFDGLDWEALEEMILTVNRWTETPIVSAEEVAGLHHPYGKGRVEVYTDIATSRYPEETAKVFETLPIWRQRLRASLPQWAPAEDE